MTTEDRIIQELARIQTPQRGSLDGSPFVHMSQGVVVGIALGSLEIHMRGQVNPTPNVRYFKWYTPAIGDNVWCLRFGSDQICMGDLETSPFHSNTFTAPPFTAGVAMEDWHYVGTAGEPTFENSWVNHTPGTFTEARFALQADGWVRLEGLVKLGTDAATIFTLPSDYCPWDDHYATGISNGAACQIKIDNTGAINKVHGGTNSYVSLENIVFPAWWIHDRIRGDYESFIQQMSPGWQGFSQSYLFPMVYKRGDGWCWLRGGIHGGTAPGTGRIAMTNMQPQWAVKEGVMIPIYEEGVGLSRMDISGEEGWVILCKGTTATRFLHNSHWWAFTGDNQYAMEQSYTNQYFQKWKDMTLLNGWVTHDALGAYWDDPSYTIDDFGIVHLRGMANGAAKTGNIIANLPDGFRPDTKKVFCTMKSDASGAIISRLDIYANGDVEVVSAGTSWNTLNGVSYKAVPAAA
jgi:hypothetical protein